MLTYPATDTVHRIDFCDLRLSGAAWAYAHSNREAIERGWQSALYKNPAYFNGVVHLIDRLERDAHGISAGLLRTDFKSYLHWREAGYPEAGVLDGFGSALLIASDGAIVLGRQRAGNVNGGLAYLPGGFIDADDVLAEGRIDIAASIAREVCEETGLTPADLIAKSGFLLTETGAHVSFAIAYDAPENAASLKARIERHIAADPGSELIEAVIVRGAADLTGLAMPRYARVLIHWLLSQDGRGD